MDSSHPFPVDRELLAYLWQSDRVVLLQTSLDLEIERCSRAFLRVAELTHCPTGTSMSSYLDPESANKLKEVHHTTLATSLRIVFSTHGRTHGIYDCDFLSTNGGAWLLIGEPASINDEEVLAEMSRLNEQLLTATRELTDKNAAIERAMSRIRRLEGLIPICMHCKKIRDEGDVWMKLEQYFSDHSDVEFSHGVCPACLDKHYPDKG